MKIRFFQYGDEIAVSALICRTLSQCNCRDYPETFIDENIRSHSPEIIRQRAEESHFYVACEDETISGCGGITGYWGSSSESYLVSIFVDAAYQGRGIGHRIVETLEKDAYFSSAWRTEVGSSLTAVGFYEKLGYSLKNGNPTPDTFGVVRMEKRLTLKTARLEIFPMCEEEMREMIEGQKSPELKQAFSEMLAGSLADPEHCIWYVPWKICRNNVVIGELGFKGPPQAGGVEIGYGIHAGYERCGYMTEAVDAAVDWALAQSGVDTVYAETSAENKASQRILEKLSFTLCEAGEEGPRFQRIKK